MAREAGAGRGAQDFALAMFLRQSSVPAVAVAIGVGTPQKFAVEVTYFGSPRRDAIEGPTGKAKFAVPDIALRVEIAKGGVGYGVYDVVEPPGIVVDGGGQLGDALEALVEVIGDVDKESGAVGVVIDGADEPLDKTMQLASHFSFDARRRRLETENPGVESIGIDAVEDDDRLAPSSKAFSKEVSVGEVQTVVGVVESEANKESVDAPFFAAGSFDDGVDTGGRSSGVRGGVGSVRLQVVGGGARAGGRGLADRWSRP